MELMAELAEFEGITFTDTFGPLPWEKFYAVKGSQQTIKIHMQWLSKRTKWQLEIGGHSLLFETHNVVLLAVIDHTIISLTILLTSSQEIACGFCQSQA